MTFIAEGVGLNIVWVMGGIYYIFPHLLTFGLISHQ